MVLIGRELDSDHALQKWCALMILAATTTTTTAAAPRLSSAKLLEGAIKYRIKELKDNSILLLISSNTTTTTSSIDNNK
jgi:hypothetical protein